MYNRNFLLASLYCYFDTYEFSICLRLMAWDGVRTLLFSLDSKRRRIFTDIVNANKIFLYKYFTYFHLQKSCWQQGLMIPRNQIHHNPQLLYDRWVSERMHQSESIKPWNSNGFSNLTGRLLDKRHLDIPIRQRITIVYINILMHYFLRHFQRSSHVCSLFSVLFLACCV